MVLSLKDLPISCSGIVFAWLVFRVDFFSIKNHKNKMLILWILRLHWKQQQQQQQFLNESLKFWPYEIAILRGMEKWYVLTMSHKFQWVILISNFCGLTAHKCDLDMWPTITKPADKSQKLYFWFSDMENGNSTSCKMTYSIIWHICLSFCP